MSSKKGQPEHYIVDATPKGHIMVVYDNSDMSPDMSIEENEERMRRVQESIDRIRRNYYYSDASVKRVQSRSFADILQAKLIQIISEQKLSKTQKQRGVLNK